MIIINVSAIVNVSFNIVIISVTVIATVNIIVQSGNAASVAGTHPCLLF